MYKKITQNFNLNTIITGIELVNYEAIKEKKLTMNLVPHVKESVIQIKDIGVVSGAWTEAKALLLLSGRVIGMKRLTPPPPSQRWLQSQQLV